MNLHFLMLRPGRRNGEGLEGERKRLAWRFGISHETAMRPAQPCCTVSLNTSGPGWKRLCGEAGRLVGDTDRTDKQDYLLPWHVRRIRTSSRRSRLQARYKVSSVLQPSILNTCSRLNPPPYSLGSIPPCHRMLDTST